MDQQALRHPPRESGAACPVSDVSGYRPDIDGLRALAIFGVLIYHLYGRYLPGGFVGVDVFFVISGYLISSIIDRDLRMGTYSIARFYERRIRRIAPVLMVMTGLVLACSVFVLLPDDMAALGKSVRYVVIAIPNIHFLRDTENYFHQSADQALLLHAWSLGVEEQFYLIFPFLLGLLYRGVKDPRWRAGVLVVLFVVSLVASAVVVPVHPMRAFFLLPYRAWELLLGVLVALVRLPDPGGRMGHWLGVGGLVMVLGSMLWFDVNTPFPGPFALIPCVGTALMIWTGRRGGSWTCRVLSFKPIVLLGLVSYSVYLLHWPLVALAKYRFSYHAGTRFGILLVCLLGGYLSWRYIEKPFRNPRFGTRARVFCGWGLASAVLLAAGLWVERAKGFPGRFPPQVRHFLSFKEKSEHWKLSDMTESATALAPVFGTPGVTPGYALWSDSHGVAMIPGLAECARNHGQSFKKFGLNALPPVVGVVKNSDKDPAGRLRYSQAVLDLLVADPSIKTVILHARWSLYSKGQKEFGQTPAAVPLYGGVFRSPDELERFYAVRIRETVDKLIAAGKQVVLIYPIPEAGVNVPDLLARQAAGGATPESSIRCDDFFERQGFVIRALDSLGESDRIARIRPYEKLLHDGRLTVMDHGQSLYMDDDHLSDAGARILKPMLDGIFSGAGNP